MYTNYILLVLSTIVGLSITAPTKSLEPRGASQCAQYSSISTGAYTIYTNEWGASSGTGSQCSTIDGLTGNTLAWDTTWTWSGTVNQVKSYTNVEIGMTSKPLSQYKSIQTSWAWSYTGTSLRCNVAYDTFLGTSATGAQAYEVMVWIGVFGGVSPLSDNGYPFTPIASPTIDNTAFNLAKGHNGNTIVYSFVAQSGAATSFSGDLLNFYKWLETNEGLSSAQYLQSVQAGSEVFTGSNAKLTTTGYSIAVS
ncbi:hypothetical protein MMC09_005614 [Bachmanniomyces sp. S44760]|nr:hypothetical protein [Bachmanniomyces sp. S44760]